MPDWTPEASLDAMARLGVATAILSVSAPVGLLCAFGASYKNTASRLLRSGAAIAGARQANLLRGTEKVMLLENDLFPTGSIELEAIDNLGESLTDDARARATVDRFIAELEASATAAEPRAQRLAVRTVVVARERNQKNWRTVWSSDVLTRTEEYVEIAPEPGAAGGLEMWVHRLPDGRYVVDAEIDWPEARLPRAYETRVLSVGKPERILTQTAEGHEYRVYQSIEPLANGNG